MQYYSVHRTSALLFYSRLSPHCGTRGGNSRMLSKFNDTSRTLVAISESLYVRKKHKSQQGFFKHFTLAVDKQTAILQSFSIKNRDKLA